MKNVKTTFNSIVSNNIGPPLTIGKKKLILCYVRKIVTGLERHVEKLYG